MAKPQKIQVYNTLTGEPELLEADVADQAIISGTHGFNINSRVNVIDPDGETVSLPAVQVGDALQDGYKLEKPNQRAVREYVEDNKGFLGSAKVFAGQAVDEALMGIPELVYDKTADPLELAKKEALKKQHDFANALGGVTGFLGSLPLGLPIARAGEKAATKLVGEQLVKAGLEEGAGLGAKVVSSAITSAGQGLAMAAPRAVTEAALGDPAEAAESLAIGMGTGALFGATTPLFKKLFKATTTVGAKGLSNVKKAILPGEEDAAMDLLSMTPSARVKFKKNYGDVVKDLPDFLKSNFTPADVMDDGAFITKLKQKEADYGKQVGSIINTIDDAIEKSTDPTLKKNLMASLDERVKASNRQLSYFVKGFEKSDSPADRSAAKQMREYLSNVEMRTEKEGFATSLKHLQELKNRIQANTNYDATVPKAVQQFYRKAAKSNADLMYGFANDFSKKFGDPSKIDRFDPGFAQLGANLADANRQLRMIKSILPFADQRAGKTGARSMFSFNNAIPAAMGAAVGGSVGGYAGAALGSAVPEVMRFLRPTLGLYYTEKAQAVLGNKLSKIPEAIQKLGGSVSNIKPASISAFGNLLDDRSNETKKTKLEQFEALNERLSEFAADPAKLVNTMAKITTPMGEAIPTIKNEYMGLLNRQLSYLEQNRPKPITANNPFMKNKWQPNDSQLNKFERIVSVVHDPFSVVNDLQNGSLTRDQIQALQAVYPKIYSRIQQKVMESVIKEGSNLNYQARLKLGLLFGPSVDQSLARIPSLQQTFVATGEDQNAKQTPNNVKLSAATNVATETDKLASEG